MKIGLLIKAPFRWMSRPKAESDGKFGTLKGVFLPNILQMLGVILFLRLGWILGHVGILQMSAIIGFSSLLLLITGLSITAIATNMRIGAGGSYYIISRSLGIEFGSSIGILLCISQSTSIALCVSGFALSLGEFFPDVPIQVFEVSTLVLLAIISYISTNLALQTQIFIFVALSVSLGALFMGSSSNIPSTLEPIATSSSMPFWIAFAMFFPAATGIEAGMSMSGDLRKPSRALPLGTIGAILVAFVLYLNVALFLSRNVSPEMLRSYPFIAYYLPKLGYLVIMGIWAASLSSALGGILGAPRVMQAVANDGILPKFLGKGFGKANQPRIATIAVFLFALVLTLLTEINNLIPILTMVCLVTYGLLNFVAFIEGLMRNPSWRPSFKVPWFVSLVGSIGCFMTMFMINAGATFIVLTAVVCICIWSSMRKIKGNWEDIRFSLFSFIVNKAIKRLQRGDGNNKNWRPNIVAFIDKSTPNKRDLIAFAHSLNQNRGFLTFSLCLPEEDKCERADLELKNSIKGFLDDIRVPAFCHIDHNISVHHSMKEIAAHYGLGPLSPNTLIIPYNENYSTNNQDLVSFLHQALGHGKNVIIWKSDSEISSSFLERPKKKNQKQIHLWWEGKLANSFKFSLALSQIFQGSSTLARAPIYVNALLTDESLREKMLAEWEKYKGMLRMKNLHFALHTECDSDVHLHLAKHASGADISFLGIESPKDEAHPSYSEYLSALFKKTEGSNKIAYVLSASKFNFGKIFFN